MRKMGCSRYLAFVRNDWLFNSSRTYLEQMNFYRARKEGIAAGGRKRKKR